MKNIKSLLLPVFAIFFSLNSFCQHVPCGGISYEIIAPDPQSGGHNYFGIKATLNSAQGRYVTVYGYLFDEGSQNTNHAFELTIPEGELTAQTALNYYETGPTATADYSISDITPSPCYSDPDYFDGLFFNAGAFHNVILSNAMFNFEIPAVSISYDSAVNLIKGFEKNYYNSHLYEYFAYSESADTTSFYFNKYKYNVNTPDFASKVLSNNDSFSLDFAIAAVNNSLLVDAANKSIFEKVAEFTRLGVNQEISQADLFDSLVGLENSWLDANEYNPNALGSEITGFALTIATKSCQWWVSNSDSIFNEESLISRLPQIEMLSGPHNVTILDQHSYLAFPVAADIAGAIVGAVTSIGKPLKQVGINAVKGAAIASLGIVGRIANWIRSIF
jgi:hypothetical protein